MIINKKDLILNIDTLICLPKEYESILEIYEMNFRYIYSFENSKESINELINFVKNGRVGQLIFVDYRLEYEGIIVKLNGYTEFGAIFTKDMASLSIQYHLDIFDGVLQLVENEKVTKLGVFDVNAYEILKAKYDCVYHILLDVPRRNGELGSQNEKSDSVLVINEETDPNHSFYNSIAAVDLANRKPTLISKNSVTSGFLDTFKIPVNKISKIKDFNGKIALYVNFCNSSNNTFFEFMDRNILCITGNNSVIQKNEMLKKFLIVDSTDSIDEIAQKILDVENHREEIFECYKEFRKEYSMEARKKIFNFIGENVIEPINEKEDILLTVGIPVYNVEEYLEESLISVLNAIPHKGAEILIVNDGSTDNSEAIIKQYLDKYPEVVRYIKQENHGLGNVRNVILENARGKYIASIDSDDTINEKFFEEAWQYLETDYDMVICDWLSIFEGNESFPTVADDTQLDVESQYKRILYSTIMPSTCNKIIKKSLYNRKNLKFIENLKFEDLGTNPIIMLEVEKIKYINKAYYEYNIRKNSIMRTAVEYNMIDILKILEERITDYVKAKFDKQEFITYVYFWRVEESIINQLYNLNEVEREKMIGYIYSNIGDILRQLYSENKYVDAIIERIDEETKKYIRERNESILNNNLKVFLNKAIKEKTYKILTPALILYNYDNR